MRIQNISVGSFGRMINREFELGPGLNVFYGPNESGKTTVMEFIRSTLVPTSRRNLYPERNKSNNGIIEAEEDGEPYLIQLDYKQRKGTVPESIMNQDPDVYRAIHAMSSSDLENDSIITSGEIYTKYLTIPGGEAVPAVIKSLESDSMDQVGTTPKSSSELNVINATMIQCQIQVADLRSKSVSYSEILDERDALEEQLGQLAEYNARARDVNAQAERADAQKESFAKLDELRSKRDDIRSRPLVDESVEEKYAALQSDIVSKKSAFDTIDAQRRSILGRLPADEDRLRSFLPRYSAAERSYPEYTQRISKPPEVRMVKNRFNPLVVVLGIAVMAIGAVPFLMSFDQWMPILGGCIAAGAAIIGIYTLARPKHEETVRDLPNEKWISDYESELKGLMESSGLKHLSAEGDVDALRNVMKVMSELDANTSQWSQSNSAFLQARNELTSFLSPFGGEQGYAMSKEGSRELTTCESRIQALSESIKSAGYDPDKPFPVIERMPLKEQEQSDVNRNIGLLDERLESIIRDGQLDQEIDRLTALAACRDAVLKQGAVTIMSSYILDTACSELYKTVQPEVLCIADRYLALMTSGLYRMDSDPRSPGLSVVSEDGKKTLDQCSSGTRAQILLSLKLAIAKQMCGGKVPMILDDVLLTFDSSRMAGACRALSEISSEMQVLLFTCNETVLQICEAIPEANVIRM